MTPLERKIRNSSGRHSLAGQRGRERSTSVLAEKTADGEQLVSDENANDYDRMSHSVVVDTVADDKSTVTTSILETYLLVRCDESCLMPFNPICWLR